MPFFPNKTYSRLRLEFTAAPEENTTHLQLLVNGTEVPASALSPTTNAAEERYFTERAAAEVGWNTWLSGDMLTHALLPHGVAIQLSFASATGATLSMLGNGGPSCDRSKFPVTHGLHAQRGQYTELQTLDFDGVRYRVQSATMPPPPTAAGGSGVADDDVVLLITNAGGNATAAGDAAEVMRQHQLVVRLAVPDPWRPRVCAINSSVDNRTAHAACPGLAAVQVQAASDVQSRGGTEPGTFVVDLPRQQGESVAALSGRQTAMTTLAIAGQIAKARSELLNDRFAAYGSHNETFAGMQTAISWNVVYTPYEGIVTPVFRGSPWAVSKPHNYVLFEWDT